MIRLKDSSRSVVLRAWFISDKCVPGLGTKHRQNESGFPFGFHSKSDSRLSGRRLSHLLSTREARVGEGTSLRDII